MYQYSKYNFTVNATPFFGHHEIKERRLYPASGQKFIYNFFGINADFQQKIKENQALSFQPYFTKRLVNKDIWALSSTCNSAINEWILQDYLFQASDISTFGASLRYDIYCKNFRHSLSAHNIRRRKFRIKIIILSAQV